eukprot:8000019-Pyramimonas_sp.AAC.1
MPRVSGFPLSHLGRVSDVKADADDNFHWFETFNANGGKRTVKRRLEKTTAKVILIQELGYLESDLEALDSWCASR